MLEALILIQKLVSLRLDERICLIFRFFNLKFELD